MPQIQSNGYCYTVNNYTDYDIACAMSLYEFYNVKYQIIGFEQGDRQGTRHLQCYVYFTNKISTTKFDAIIADTFDCNPHTECQKAKKNVAAYVYCMEEYDYFEQGERPRQGHRTDLEAIKHDILAGRPDTQISKEYFSQWCQYRRAFQEFRSIHQLDRRTTKLLMYTSNTDLLGNMIKFHQIYADKKIYVHQDVNFNLAIVLAAQGIYDFILCDSFFVPQYTKDGLDYFVDYI